MTIALSGTINSPTEALDPDLLKRPVCRQRQAAGRTNVPTIAVIMPTYQRRNVIVGSVERLAEQRYGGDYEVVVVVDGSTDGTAKALRALRLPLALRVTEQQNRGAAAARNIGARLARADILLFLDDDMAADPDLLGAHARAHIAGADAVVGHIPLHPESPRGFLSRAVALWAEQRRERLSEPGARLLLSDLLTGNLSVRRDLFERLGGFDQRFTEGGSFGNEDLDFGVRLLESGAVVTFSAAAVSWQRYVVSPAINLKQWREGGEADVRFARKHPSLANDVFAVHRFSGPWTRLVVRPLAAAPGLSSVVAGAAKATALAAARNWPSSRVARRAFYMARDLEYWRGVHARGGLPRRRPVLVLAYHGIVDLRGDPLLEPYAVPPAEFEAQLDVLLEHGCTFVSAEELLGSLQKGLGLPRRPVLLTFDDCYEDLLQVAAPMLRARGIPALAFAVSGLTGCTNVWDQRKGGRALRLLDAAGLAELARYGIEIGAHSRSHPDLTGLDEDALMDELAGEATELGDASLPRPRFLAYPHGRHNQTVRRAAAAAGFRLAFG
ncbi:MAG: glycosyltransferase, partial [Geminicoccaceae bacterium]